MAFPHNRGFLNSRQHPDIEALLTRKYDILQQNADSQTARAGAATTTANTAQGLADPRAALLLSQAFRQREEGAVVGANAASDRRLNRARGGLLGAQTTQQRQLNSLVDPDFFGLSNIFKYRNLGSTSTAVGDDPLTFGFPTAGVRNSY